MSISLTCYGGACEIGGNKILLEDGDCRILLDFGIAFGEQGRYFSELLRPRASRGLLDPLALDLLPSLEGLYRSDIALPDLWQRMGEHRSYRNLNRGNNRPAVDGIFISHAHMDHNGDLGYVAADILIYTTRTSAFIARAMQVTAQSTLDKELTFVSSREIKEAGTLGTSRNEAIRIRPHRFLDGQLEGEAELFWRNVPTSKTVIADSAMDSPATFCGLAHHWWPVDHSIPGAASLALQTSAGWVGYTGDLRLSGSRGALTRRFAEELAALHPTVLLCEGTHIESNRNVTEETVFHNALDLVQQEHGLVVADFGARNIERLLSFLEIARVTGRQLLVQPKDIYLLHAISLANSTVFPEPYECECLAMYDDVKSAPRSWEKALREQWADHLVSPDDVSRRPGRYILAYSLWDLNDLIDLTGITRGIYIYSNTKAYDEEQAADLDRLRNWVSIMGLTLHGDPEVPSDTPLHTSGHASGPDLLELVRIIHPRILIPIHTEKPALWQDMLTGEGIEVILPTKNEPIIVD
jgi:ribonuclease J